MSVIPKLTDKFNVSQYQYLFFILELDKLKAPIEKSKHARKKIACLKECCSNVKFHAFDNFTVVMEENNLLLKYIFTGTYGFIVFCRITLCRHCNFTN